MSAAFRKAALFSLAILWLADTAFGQAPGRYVGTVTSITGDVLTVKADDGDVKQVQVPATAQLKRVEPGQRDLSAAVTIQFADLATGDRVLVRTDPASVSTLPQAAMIVTIKQADVALRQQHDREEWQHNGVGGLVKSVNANAGTIEIASGTGTSLRLMTILVKPSTVLKRYAPTSVRYDLAKTAPISAIQVGDQLRARGGRSADGAAVDADEVISGTFRNVSGVISSLDSAGSTLALKDLTTKKQLTIHVTEESQLRALPDAAARTLAAHLKSEATPGASDAASDAQQILNRAQAIEFSSLKKGDAVLVVSAADGDKLTAITLLSGVEPLLEAPEASSNLLANWSIGGAAPAQ